MSRSSLSYPVISGYEIQECIGKGSVGEVYRGVDTQTGATVAIKILKPDIVASDPEAVERFQREAEVLRTLNHPNIVNVLATFEDDGLHYLVTEYIPAGSLRNLLEKEGRLRIERVLEIALDLVDALTRAHRLGIIHRDIKPGNVLLKNDGTPLLSDFGLAGVRDSKMTQVGTMMGTPAYLSPEVCQGQQADARSDIWALGVMLFEMLSGELPFNGDNIPAIMMAITTQPTPDLAPLCPDAPAELRKLIQQMLEKDREIRLSSVRLLGADLEALMLGTKHFQEKVTTTGSQQGRLEMEWNSFTEIKFASQLPAFLTEEIDQPQERPLFVARQNEMEVLNGFLKDTVKGKGSVVFIIGEAGSGKTALVDEFTLCAQEAIADLVVAYGNCNAHTGVGDPYLPFREVLEMLTGEVEARWAAGAISSEYACRLWNTFPAATQALVECGQDLIGTFVRGSALAERAATFSPTGSVSIDQLQELVQRKMSEPAGSSLNQSDLFEQYNRVLHALSQKVPLVLVLDDLQWADNGSINLLFHLGRNLVGNRILIVGTFRPEEIAMGRDGTRHPLESIVNELQRLFGHSPVDVDQAESRNFMDWMLDSEPNRFGTAFREMLYRQTRGQPLFTIELLRGMQERGDLIKDENGVWIEGPALNWEKLPARVEAVIAERIGRLAEPHRAALEVATVEGQTFSAEVVARVLATSEREMLRLFSSELDRKHHIIHSHSIQRINGQLLSFYHFRHILFQKYLYSSLDDIERVHLHEQVGIALEELYETQEKRATIAPHLARHFQEARNVHKAIDYLRLAGERAVHMSAHQEAVSHLKKSLALLMTTPESAERNEQELALQLALGMAWITSSAPDPEGKIAYTRARELCGSMGKTTQLCQVLGELSVFHYVHAEHQMACELAEEALELAQLAQDPLLVMLGHCYLGFIRFCLGEFSIALDHLEQVIAFYKPEQHHSLLITLSAADLGLSGMAYAACCLWLLGYPEQALSLGKEAITIARKMKHTFTLADVLCFAGCFLNVMRRDALPLKENAEELLQIANEMNYPGWLGMAISFKGLGLALLGQIQEGIEQMREGIEIRLPKGIRLNLTEKLGSLAEMQSKAGTPDEGLASLTEAFALVEKTDEHYWEAELYRLKGELMLMQVDETGAEGSFKKAIQIARNQEAKSWELRATTSLARLWQKQGRTEEARQALVQIYQWFSEGFDTPELIEAKSLLEELI